MSIAIDDKLLDVIDDYWDKLCDGAPDADITVTIGGGDTKEAGDTNEAAQSYFSLLRELDDARRILREDSHCEADTPVFTLAEPPEIPKQFGRYDVQRQLGQGGMGTVFLAHDTQLHRDVALKVPYFLRRDEANVRERFQREARAAATLHHPNICPVFDIGEIEAIPYLTMAFIDGQPLAASQLRAGDDDDGVSAQAVAVLIRKVAAALDHAHARGIIHRDLKPSNILVDRAGEPVVVDFGLARLTEIQDATLTQGGSILGTPAYMSPEQALADLERIGPVSDVYSLGVIFFQLLTGRLPYREPQSSILAQIVAPEPLNIDGYGAAIDPDLRAICTKALAKRGEDRFASMAEFATALQNYLEGNRTALAALARPAKPVSEMKTGVLVGAALMLLIAGLAFGGLVVVKLQTPDGTLVVEVNEPGAKVTVLNERGEVEVTRSSDGGTLKLSVDPGKHRLKVEKSGFAVFAKEFSIGSGESESIKATLIPPQDPDKDLSDFVKVERLENLERKAKLASASSRAHDYATSAALWKEVWEGRQETPGPQHHLTVDAQNLFGESLTKQGKYEEAERHLLDSYATVPQAKDFPTSWIPIYRQRLVSLYDSWGKPAEASKWRGDSRPVSSEQLVKDRELIEVKSASPPAQNGNPRGLIAHWPGDGHARDDAGPHAGISSNGKYADGHFKQAFKLNGVRDYIRVPDRRNFDFKEGMTIAAWIMPDTLQGHRAVASKWNSFNDCCFNFKVAESVLHFYLSAKTHIDLGQVIGATKISPRTWTHIAATYSGDQAAVYVNGELDRETQLPKDGRRLRTATADLMIGATCHQNIVNQFFPGLIDEVLLFNRGLDAAEIKAIYLGDAEEQRLIVK